MSNGSEALEIPYPGSLVDYDMGLVELPGIMRSHSRETYQPTSIIRWDKGVLNGSILDG